MVSDIRDSNAFGTLTSVENLSFGRRTSIINQSERIDSKTENLLNLIFLNRNGFRKKNPIFQFLDFYKNGRSQKEKSFIWRKIEWLSTRGQGRRKKVNWVFHGKICFCDIFPDFGRVMWALEGGRGQIPRAYHPDLTWIPRQWVSIFILTLKWPSN